MIQVRGLTKYYGNRAAILNLDFDIARGEVIGFLGRNGAGKTTVLKILSSVLLPTSGSVTIDGVDVVRDAHTVRGKIGFLPDTPPLYNEMTVGRYLRFAAELRGISRQDVPARVAEAEDKMSLRDVHDAPIASLSHGYRQRVGVAQALVHRPALLILDEPTAGLDPIQIVEMREIIRKLRGEHTVLISSHILAEISQTCDRLLVIHHGEIVAQGREEDLARALGHGTEIEVMARGSEASIRTALTGIPGLGTIDIVPNPNGQANEGLLVRLSASDDVRPAVARALVSAGIDLLRLDCASSRLEALFLELARTGPATDSSADRVVAGAAAPVQPESPS